MPFKRNRKLLKISLLNWQFVVILRKSACSCFFLFFMSVARFADWLLALPSRTIAGQAPVSKRSSSLSRHFGTIKFILLFPDVPSSNNMQRTKIIYCVHVQVASMFDIFRYSKMNLVLMIGSCDVDVFRSLESSIDFLRDFFTMCLVLFFMIWTWIQSRYHHIWDQRIWKDS